ncbi:MAG: type III-B CRISPR module RAMP protein Cmr6 [Firmicutes bacterium]|nr:type III-B CRISPR module RAMP protein Cmr6 [Bacillota bacterium]
MVQMCRDRIRDLVAWNATSNAGLLLSSFLEDDSPDARKKLLDVVRRAPAMARDVYIQAFALLREGMPKDSVSELVEVDGRAIIGLGTELPLETGLTLHHTYGVPFIPGSALKGLASHYCHQVWGARDSGFERGGANFLVLFGRTEDSGHIIFNDAWISPESLANCLDIDVMTVHHPSYYQPEEPQPPSDYDDPTPIAFLSVKGRYWISLHCDVPGDSGKAWAKLAMKLLLEALGNWGIGAKTNAGYGRMRKVEEVVRQTGAVPNGDRRTAAMGPAGRSAPTEATSWRPPCKPGDRVEAILSAEKTKKGGWKAIYEAGGQRWVGHIQNTSAVPADAKPGDRVKLIVKSINAKDAAFEWFEGV